jgi:hypothetical protein
MSTTQEYAQATETYTKTTPSDIDLVVEVRGVEQGNRPVSVSFTGINVKSYESDEEQLISFEGPYEAFSPPGSKGIDMAVEAPIFLGLAAHIFCPAVNLRRPSNGRSVPSIWTLSGFDATLTVTTRFFGYKKGANRSPVQVGLSQLTANIKGSPFGATNIGVNVHFWNAPDFALSFQNAKITMKPAGFGRLALSADYSWNQGEWTAKTRGFLILNGNPFSIADHAESFNTSLQLSVHEKVSDNTDGILSGSVKGKILRTR